jgi:hypothetical protein
MNLHDLTKETHHKAENSLFGARYSAGILTPREYVSWLDAQYKIHELVDRVVPCSLHRCGPLARDMTQLYIYPPAYNLGQTYEFLAFLKRELPYSLLAASYILYGAHLQGGAVIKPRLVSAGLPVAHLEFGEEAKQGRIWLKGLRELADLGDLANEAFQRIINIMDEIYERAYEDGLIAQYKTG